MKARRQIKTHGLTADQCIKLIEIIDNPVGRNKRKFELGTSEVAMCYDELEMSVLIRLKELARRKEGK